MVTHYSVLTVCLLVTFTGGAQTLTDATTSPQPGDTYTVYTTGYRDPGDSGSDVVWDFSDLSASFPDPYTFVIPASTAYAADFPASTVAQVVDGDNIIYLQCDATGILKWGEVLNEEVHDNTDPELLLPFPCAYQDEWSDDLAGSFLFAGMQNERTGGLSAVADAYGTLILPYGTLENVLRVRVDRTVVDQMEEAFKQTMSTVSYYYYHIGVHLPVVTIFNGVISSDFGETPIELTNWVAEGSVGMQRSLGRSVAIEVFPVPATGRVSVVFTADGSATSTLQVIDASGRTIHQRGLGQRSAGIQLEQLDVTGFAPGVYSVCITDGKGGRGVQRLVVE